ncbi:hypothetical protein MTR67_002024 [Solanum verrucosum]|uniref:Signal recognition particle subunit SRP72 n=1 Tax=Solanum verrucosum TaxID=315347 RepID=A0AAF0PPA6_SOLVR|nr:hypothetical protein MTR67_002024 [Solanum verrucosum]
MLILLQAAVHVRENKAAKAEEILGQYADKFPDRSKVILLARAQVAAAAGHPQIAADSLAKIPDIQHKPATVATIVSLKERAGDTDGADAVFDSAIKWWSNAMTEDNKLNTIMQEAAAFKLRHGRKEEAARLYGQLVKSHGSKGFDPANPRPPPDPERWLPKRERSSYRPKRKDKRTAQIRGSQGAVAKEAASNSDMKSNQPANPKGASQNAVQSKASSKS